MGRARALMPAGAAIDHSGLSSDEARRRLEDVGPNELPPPLRPGVLRRLAGQLVEPLTLLLISAAAVSGIALQEWVDAVAILAIVVLNSVIGLVQEGRATAALDALRQLESPVARVRRQGRVVPVAAREVVPGDLVLVTAGDRVAADLLLTRAMRLEVDEAILTGESLPVGKRVPGTDDPPAETELLAGTLVTAGTGEGVVVDTGPRTQLGRIAAELQAPQSHTPLQRELAGVSRWLGAGAIAVAVLVFVLVATTTSGDDRVEEGFLSAVALAVAAVPEGLATVTTVALALGVRRMADRGAIVRRLTAVETLGSTTVIVMDKTGTLTENRLELEGVVLAGAEPTTFEALGDTASGAIAEVAALCNDATTDPPSGDPVDLALLDAVGRDRVEALRAAWPQVSETPFDAVRAYMASVHRGADGATLVTLKGAPEVVLPRSRRVLDADGSEHSLTEPQRDELLDRADGLAHGGAKVLALARVLLAPGSPFSDDDDGADHDDLTLVALVALRDPIRAAAHSSVADAHRAGIRLVMATGDHPGTATRVATTVGLAPVDARAVSGGVLPDGEKLGDADVYARVDPEQKLALVRALRAGGEVVAMTGDGVNDAPALRQADIGVALGKSGTEVAREAADLVVTDDDLGTIVAATREGRGIYDNIRKVVDYLVTGNLSEIALVVVGLLLFAKEGVPLLPLQLLWINLVTDGAPALALGVDPVEDDVLSRPPRPPSVRLLNASRLVELVLRAVILAMAPLAGLVIAYEVWDQPWDEARTVAFTLLVVTQLLYPLAIGRVFKNRWLAAAIVTGLLIQVPLVTWAPAREVFDTTTLDGGAWLLVATLPALAVLLVGVMIRRRARTPSGGVASGPAPPAGRSS